jgi:hypothetical protein
MRRAPGSQWIDAGLASAGFFAGRLGVTPPVTQFVSPAVRPFWTPFAMIRPCRSIWSHEPSTTAVIATGTYEAVLGPVTYSSGSHATGARSAGASGRRRKSRGASCGKSGCAPPQTAGPRSCRGSPSSGSARTDAERDRIAGRRPTHPAATEQLRRLVHRTAVALITLRIA